MSLPQRRTPLAHGGRSGTPSSDSCKGGAAGGSAGAMVVAVVVIVVAVVVVIVVVVLYSRGAIGCCRSCRKHVCRGGFLP